MNSKKRKKIDASVSNVNLPISKKHSTGFYTLKEAVALGSHMYSDLLKSPLLKQHKLNNVEHSATALLLRGSGTC